MKHQSSLLFATILTVLALQCQVSHATNKYPIVLVHGLTGWGRDELAGFKYWGGLYGDYQEQLKKQGFQVFTAAVGPFSSNWDRASELYAQIKGGRVDYGANHSQIHGHARYGRTFPGFYPQWGDVVDGQLQKVHLIGHSMGGQTIRMLTQLLNGGSKGADGEEDPASHPLFAGGKDWVHSVTTVSTPNQGSTLADGLNNVIDLIEDTIASIFGLAGTIGSASAKFYDAKLDQWGISPKQEGESMRAYIHRILSSRMFEPGFRDISGYCLTTYGARAENKWVKTLPHVYYYSFVTEDTFMTKNILLQDIALPNPFSMSPIVQPLATFIGSRFTTNLGFPESWLPNDGLVNIPSQVSDGQGRVVRYTGRSVRGAWNRFDTIHFMDHLAIIGFKPLCDVYGIYRAHAGLLNDLPSHEELARSLRRLDENGTVVVDLDHPTRPENNVLAAIAEVQTALDAQQPALALEECARVSADEDQALAALCALYVQTIEIKSSGGRV